MRLYNVCFDISAILLYLVIIGSYYLKKHVHNTQYKYFTALIVVSFITPFIDILAVFITLNKTPKFVIVLLTDLHYLTKQATALLFLLFTISQAELTRSMHYARKIFSYLPSFVVLIIVIANDFTDCLIPYDGTRYKVGDVAIYTYIIYIFYFVWAAIYTIVHRKNFNKNFPIVISFIALLNIIAQGIQIFFSLLLLHSFASALSFAILLLNYEQYNSDVDAHTGIAKKRQFERICKRLIYSKEPFQVIFIRMKDYLASASQFGTETLENILSQIEIKLFKQAKEGELYRISNGTAAILLQGSRMKNNVAQEIYDCVKRPWTVKGVEYAIDAYLSELFFPQDFTNWEQLFDMLQFFKTYTSPKSGILPKEEFSYIERIREKEVQKAVEKAIQNGSFEMYYQPICKAHNQEFITAEALIRLHDEKLGDIPPGEFIPIAEKTGSIIQVGNWVIDSVCKFIATHDLKKLGLEYIELNLSTIQCLQTNFIETVEEIVSKYNISPKHLCFEITETASSLSPEIFKKNLKALTERGYILALDDFGTGYGNLERMISSNFKIIKIDKNMTQSLTSDDHFKKIYVSLQKMISAMGLHIVSEGVETEDQFDFIRKTGFGYIQGYYFSKPLPEKEFCEFLLKRRGEGI